MGNGKRLFRAAVAGLWLVLSAGATGTAGAQNLRIGLAEDPDVLDPSQARTFVGRIVFAALCDKLVDISPDLQIVPQLATEWHWVDDNKGLVMTLRRGVLFHDGETLDAAAVKYSIERHLTMPESVRKSEIGAVKAVEIVDDHTVKFVLSAPFAPLLAQLSDRAGMIVAPAAAKTAGANFGAHPVCAGPFKFVERVAQDRIVVERFPDYWDKDKIKLDRITFLPIVDSTVKLANLQSGALDIIERIAATDVDTVKKDDRLRFASITGLGYVGITINLAHGDKAKNPLGQDARVRQAFEASIDREALNQVVFNGLFTPGNQWVPPDTPYYVKELPVPPRDLARAKRLLAEANAPHPSFTMMVPNTPELLQAAQVIQAMTAEAGFDVKIQSTEFASALQLGNNGDFEAFQIGWSGRTDPDGNIYNFVACHSALNDPRYCNATVDRELDAARLVEAPAERLAHYKVAAEQLLKDLPIVYLWHPKWLWAMSTKLQGFTPYPDALIRPQGLTLR